MTTVDSAAVAVVGGGPAGAVTPLLLARAGVAVVLYEQSRYDTLRLGETLPPSVNPLLRELNLWERFHALRSVPSYQTASAWGGAEPADRSFLFSPHGHGWHVDRARFDHMLVEAAEEGGARVLRGTPVRRVSHTGAGLLVEAAEPVRAAAVVDATGRAARIAKALGANREQLDRLVCAARVFTTGTQPAGDTFIEASPSAWWYASPLPQGRRLIAFFTDAHHVVRARLATVEGWAASLARTDHVRHFAHGTPHGKVRVVTCASHELRPSAGRDWIAVGDAALAVDPLSSAASRSPCAAPPRPPTCCSAATGPPTRASSPPRHANTDRYAPRSTAGNTALPRATSGAHEPADPRGGDCPNHATSQHDPHARALDDAAESVRPLPVAIADEDPVARQEPIDGVGEVPRRLGHECGIGMGRRARHVDPPAPEIDHKERVVGHEPARGPDLGREEVGSRDRAPVGPEERPPRGRPVRSRRDPVGLKHFADRIPGHAVAQVLQCPWIRV
jgi:flavin-dependent dehydrogenase